MRAAVAAVVLLASGTAQADRDAARIDWVVGQVIAGGIGLADRHAPSPAVALGTSRRGAAQAAKRKIIAKLGQVPLAGGGTLATKLADPAVQARVTAAVEAAIELSADPETDGSWHVTLGVPLEAIRQALAGPRQVVPAGDHGPPVVIVDGVTAKPALGFSIAGAAATTLWVKTIPAWAHDAPHITATGAAAGAIQVKDNPGAPATLYLIVTRS